jgi:hypothetical protein
MKLSRTGAHPGFPLVPIIFASPRLTIYHYFSSCDNDRFLIQRLQKDKILDKSVDLFRQEFEELFRD